mgnify:FL=1
MILLIDNYDSFSYNLYQLIGAINPEIKVIRNDELTAEEIEALKPEAIILSPGPGRPQDAGCCIEVVQKLGGKIPILGVCLGHQVICEAYGGVVSYAKQLMHGKQSVTKLDTKTPLFVGLPEETTVARYHSLAAQEENFPECLQVTARTSDGEIMALQHKTKAVYGVQFHPESILTPLGKKMLENFLQLANAEKKEKTMIKEAIVKLAAKQNLDYETAEASMDEIMGGKASPVQMSAFLTAMAMKGETIEEITACAAGMRKHCVRLLHDQDVLEIVGTGGDHSNSFNISTTSSLVISAAGVPVAKHGNRAASSKSGAADVLEALGVKITIDPAKSAEVLKKIGLCFLFAQNYHLSMKYVAPVRKELGIRTIFNILGPLTNPAGANMELMGVYDEALVEPLARVLANLGVKKAMVVYGQDGLDEISMSAPTTVCEVKDGEFLSYVITPEQFGFTRCSKDELIGGSPQDNAQIALAILKGEKGPRRDAVVLNSAAAIHIAKGISIEDAIREAQEVIESGKFRPIQEEHILVSGEQAKYRDILFTDEFIFGLYSAQVDAFYKSNFDESYGVKKILINKLSDIYGQGTRDLRQTHWFKTSWGTSYLLKHNADLEYAKEKVRMITLAEMYYIAAEAHPAEAYDLLEEILPSREIHSSLPVNAGRTEVLTEVLKEYRKEYIGDGQFFYAYKRLIEEEAAIHPLGINIPNENKVLVWPLPQDEIKYGDRESGIWKTEK